MSLSTAQLAHLERRLREERARATALLARMVAERRDASTVERAGDLSVAPHHAADAGTDSEDDEVEISNAARISDELAEIDAALERFYRTPERFGISETTGKPIPFARLDTIPWARSAATDERPAS